MKLSEALDHCWQVLKDYKNIETILHNVSIKGGKVAPGRTNIFSAEMTPLFSGLMLCTGYNTLDSCEMNGTKEWAESIRAFQEGNNGSAHPLVG